MYSIPMKGITCCGDCVYYNTKKHKCNRCNSIETDARSHFYDDCPLPDVVKAQEPRVMTLDEIPDAVFGWMEMFGQIIPCVLEDVYADDTVGFANIEDGHDYMDASDYGKTWRVWTSCPTDKQRVETPWEER